KFIVWVFAGWPLVRARDLRFISPLIRDDFPTLDFPAKATSGIPVSGSRLVTPHTISSSACLITFGFFSVLDGIIISSAPRESHLSYCLHRRSSGPQGSPDPYPGYLPYFLPAREPL